MPIKCPVAPLEFCFLADWYFTERGIRDQVEITYATPLDGAFTKPVASATLAGLLEEKGIELVTEFNTGEVDGDGDGGKLVGYDGREVPFDLAVVIPLHSGADYVGRSEGLGDDLDFVPTDQRTLQSDGQAEHLRHRRRHQRAGLEGRLGDPLRGRGAGREHRPLPRGPRRSTARYDGHANCFIETGFGKALLIDFNYETEPLPGHFPARVGMPLLKESRLNHLGKLMFQWFYWHALLPGRDIPGIGADMPKRGKHRPDTRTEEAHRMSTATYAGVAVDVNDEGLLRATRTSGPGRSPSSWRKADGIDELTDQHWQVIDFMRKEYFEKGTGPTVRVLGKTSGVSVKELYQLFPKGPAKMAARIAGIPKPKGCI